MHIAYKNDSFINNYDADNPVSPHLKHDDDIELDLQSYKIFVNQLMTYQ